MNISFIHLLIIGGIIVAMNLRTRRLAWVLEAIFEVATRCQWCGRRMAIEDQACRQMPPHGMEFN